MVTFTRRQFNASMLSAACLPLIGCGKKEASGQGLKIGVLLPTSGHQASHGQQCKKGSDVAVEVLKNVLGVDFEVVFADTESNVNTGRTRAEKLIQEGAHVLVGAFDSGVSAAIAQVCEQKQVPFIVNISAAPQITEQGYKYTFRNFPTGPMLIRNAFGLMKEIFSHSGVTPKKAAFMYVKENYGEAMRMGIEKIFPTMNMPFEIVTTLGYDPKTQDLSTEIAKVKESGAEMIMPVTRLEDAVLIVKEVLKQKLNIMGILNPGSPGMYEKDFFTHLGEKSNYWISNTAWFNPKAKITEEYSRVFLKQFPSDFIETSSAFTFEAIHIACDAFKRAKTAEAPALRQAIAETKIEDHLCLGGTIEFDEKGQTKNLRSASLQNMNGKPNIIFPQEVREIDPIFPLPTYKA